MHRYVVRTIAFFILASAVACGTSEVGSSTLKDLDVGMTRTEVLTKIGTGPLTAVGSDSARLVNGFRHMRFFNAGKNFEVIYFRDEPGSVSDPVEQKLETPIVLADDKVLGTGWQFYVDAMKTYGLPTPLLEKVVPPPAATDTGIVSPVQPMSPPNAPGSDTLARKM